MGLQWKKCGHCGQPLSPYDGMHICNVEQLAAWQAASIDKEVGAWLATPDGQFAVYYAETRRPA